MSSDARPVDEAMNNSSFEDRLHSSVTVQSEAALVSVSAGLGDIEQSLLVLDSRTNAAGMKITYNPIYSPEFFVD